MLSIGQFSKTCMVTVKTLRHYDKIGLLSPEYVNEENGYRFYTEEQIPVMILINKYDMPIKLLSKYLHLNPQLMMMSSFDREICFYTV